MAYMEGIVSYLKGYCMSFDKHFVRFWGGQGDLVNNEVIVRAGLHINEFIKFA